MSLFRPSAPAQPLELVALLRRQLQRATPAIRLGLGLGIGTLHEAMKSRRNSEREFFGLTTKVCPSWPTEQYCLPQWVGIERNTLTVVDLWKIWARRVALAIHLDAQDVFPWKFKDYPNWGAGAASTSFLRIGFNSPMSTYPTFAYMPRFQSMPDGTFVDQLTSPPADFPYFYSWNFLQGLGAFQGFLIANRWRSHVDDSPIPALPYQCPLDNEGDKKLALYYLSGGVLSDYNPLRRWRFVRDDFWAPVKNDLGFGKYLPENHGRAIMGLMKYLNETPPTAHHGTYNGLYHYMYDEPGEAPGYKPADMEWGPRYASIRWDAAWKKRRGGCPVNSVLLGLAVRSLNIPSEWGAGQWGHYYCFFPTAARNQGSPIGLGLPHGDEIWGAYREPFSLDSEPGDFLVPSTTFISVMATPGKVGGQPSPLYDAYLKAAARSALMRAVEKQLAQWELVPLDYATLQFWKRKFCPTWIPYAGAPAQNNDLYYPVRFAALLSTPNPVVPYPGWKAGAGLVEIPPEYYKNHFNLDTTPVIEDPSLKPLLDQFLGLLNWYSCDFSNFTYLGPLGATPPNGWPSGWHWPATDVPKPSV